MHAKAETLAPYLETNLLHSKLDLPVVITSSTIKTFYFFFIKKLRLNLKILFSLSANIVFVFNNFPIS